MPVIPATPEAEVGGSRSEATPGQNLETLSEKQTKSKKTEGVDQVVECLPSKCKALNSIPSTTKKEKTKQNIALHPTPDHLKHSLCFSKILVSHTQVMF
jgi:hypothetical protein